MTSFRHAAVSLLVFSMAGVAAAQDRQALPKVRVVATGGTIAGEQREPGTLGGYEVKKSVNEIVSLIPHVERYARIFTDRSAPSYLCR